ncbi:MAG: hypothetical protein ABSD97_02930 [Acidimicrobiales bacterium]
MSRPLRFEGKTMEAARLKARERLGADVTELNVLRHGRELYGGIFGFFQRERYVIELGDPAQARATAPVAPQAGPFEEGGFQAALSKALSPAVGTVFEMPPAEALSPGELASGEIAVPDRLAGLLESTEDTVGVCFDRELKGVIEDAEAVVSDAAGSSRMAPEAVVPSSGAWPVPTKTRPPAPLAFSFGICEAGRTSLSERLSAAGLAEEYLPDPLFSEPALALPLRLGTIPAPGPVLRRAGDVLVLVGDVGESLALAQQLARRIDEDEAVLVVSHRRLSSSLAHSRARSPLEAGTLVLERRLNASRSVVVLDSSCRPGFVPRAVAGIRPEAIWGVVPASFDERRARGLEALVGHLDALALYGLASSERPAGLIGRSWPISYLDGWEASPLSIAARLVEAIKAEDL